MPLIPYDLSIAAQLEGTSHRPGYVAELRRRGVRVEGSTALLSAQAHAEVEREFCTTPPAAPTPCPTCGHPLTGCRRSCPVCQPEGCGG